MKYIKRFKTVDDAVGTYPGPQLSYCDENTQLLSTVGIDLKRDEEIDVAKKDESSLIIPDYFTLSASAAGSISLSNTNNTPNIEYSKNDGEWTTWDYSAISVDNGDKVRFRGLNSNGFSTSSGFANYSKFALTGNFNASGNIMTLIDKKGASLEIPDCPACFRNLFVGQTSLKSINGFKLPATTLHGDCYSAMFRASGITDASTLKLPALTMSYHDVSSLGCYGYMFYGCTSLTKAPELPATTLAMNCYYGMFANCASLTTAPSILPATELINGYIEEGYQNSPYAFMFYGCTSLTQAPELPATTLGDFCYFDMFTECTSLIKAPELPATKLADSCYYGMFDGCTSLTIAPELPATELVNGYKKDDYYYSPYALMFYGCTALTAAPELPATTLLVACYYLMFTDCTSLTAAPELPATKLADSCYYGMFYGCKKLNSVTMLAENVSASNCLSYWLYNVSSSGTFTKKAGTTLPSGASGIPSGWTVEEV